MTTTKTSRSKIIPITDWEGHSTGDLVEQARWINGLTVREAAEVARQAGHPISFCLFSRDRANTSHGYSVSQGYATLGIPLDLLEIRRGLLPPGAEDDLEFQDEVYRLWHKHRGLRVPPSRPHPQIVAAMQSTNGD